MQRGRARDSAVLALRVRRRPDRDGVTRRAGHSPEGSAAGLGQREPAIYEQRAGRRVAAHQVSGGLDALIPQLPGVEGPFVFCPVASIVSLAAGSSLTSPSLTT